ncbi:MAG: cytochrome c biogenesis protein ResB [Pyrinomonadaceae bacterium]
MSAVEETIRAKHAASIRRTVPIGNRILDFLSSVRLGVTLLCVLVVLAMIGMLIVQQNVPGFDAYYASRTPAEKSVYGTLGFFDIYHSIYFNLLLLILSLNIILASIDRFPSAWKYITQPKDWATKKWLLVQPQNALISLPAENVDVARERIASVLRENGFRTKLAEKNGHFYVFGERGRFNRIGAYIVHVFLLILFLGHFVANQTGFDADVRMIPGDRTEQIQLIQFDLDKKEKFNVQLPFAITCTDIQQTLVDPGGSIDVVNTMDWHTRIKIDDPSYGVTEADVSLNKPFTYRGYRFFQAQTIPIGNARNITLDLTRQSDSEKSTIDIPRAGSAALPDGTNVEYSQFFPDFTFNAEGKPDTKSGNYNNPVAVLNVTPPGGQRTRVFAFSGVLPDNMPVGAPKAGYKWRLKEYEKSPYAHVLSIKYDPFSAAFVAWYIGGFGLIAALAFIFFISHRRIWALVEEAEFGKVEVTLGGNSNRNPFGFADKFSMVVSQLKGSE